jgi:hypothetical protein
MVALYVICTSEKKHSRRNQKVTLFLHGAFMCHMYSGHWLFRISAQGMHSAYMCHMYLGH